MTGVVLGVEFSKHDNKLPNNVAVGVLVSSRAVQMIHESCGEAWR